MVLLVLGHLCSAHHQCRLIFDPHCCHARVAPDGDLPRALCKPTRGHQFLPQLYDDAVGSLLSGPISRAILRYYHCKTPHRAIHSRRGQHCAIPYVATYRAINVRCPTQKKQARKSFAILSLQVLRDMRSIAAGPD